MPSPFTTSRSIPDLDTSDPAGRADPTPSGDGSSEFTVDGCAVHHVPGKSSDFPTLTGATVSGEIDHQDLSSVKISLNSMIQNFNDRGYKTNYVRYLSTNKNAGEIIDTSDWEKFRNALMGFGFSIDKPDKLSAQYYNELKQSYDNYINNCLCNSDCNCNSVCACNADCGCNYSDKRLKKDIVKIGTLNIKGTIINKYEFYYINSFNLPKMRQVGVIAQELLSARLDKYVIQNKEYYQVDYIALYNDAI